jgi:murein DD-endopeptidase MepM/ murein hydrolase activator NlpD
MTAKIEAAKAQEAARTAVAEARVALEKVRAEQRLQKIAVRKLVRKSQRAARRAAHARRDMGNMARAAYSSGNDDLNLLAALLQAKSPQEVLSGAESAARIAGHKDVQWRRALRLQEKSDRLAEQAQAVLDRSSRRLTNAESSLEEALALAAAVDLALAPPADVPPVDLTTKSDWVFPSATGQIGSEAGMRMHPILHYVRCHEGADISAPAGTPIYAVDDGVVLSAGVNGGYGNFTLIAHGNGMTSGYAHQQLMLVKAGDRVARGQLIGEVGTTGLSTGAHLHFEARYHGVPYNPRGWLEDKPELRVPVC